MELRKRYEFRLVSDNSREGRLQVDQTIRRYQLTRIDSVVNSAGKIVGTGELVPLPLIVQRSQMERIEKMRRECVRKIGQDPILSIATEIEEQIKSDPFVLLRQQMRNSGVA